MVSSRFGLHQGCDTRNHFWSRGQDERQMNSFIIQKKNHSPKDFMPGLIQWSGEPFHRPRSCSWKVYRLTGKLRPVRCFFFLRNRKYPENSSRKFFKSPDGIELGSSDVSHKKSKNYHRKYMGIINSSLSIDARCPCAILVCCRERHPPPRRTNTFRT